MTPTRRRLFFVGLGLSSLVTASLLALNAFDETIVFFYSPTDLTAKFIGSERVVRVGGLVKSGTLKKSHNGLLIQFDVTDLQNSISTTYRGVLPDLFGENQGVVAEGIMNNGDFMASNVLAKHDENYMPAEVAKKLKDTGVWKGVKKN